MSSCAIMWAVWACISLHTPNTVILPNARYAALCRAISAMPRYATACHVVKRRAMTIYGVPRHATAWQRHAKACHVMRGHATAWWDNVRNGTLYQLCRTSLLRKCVCVDLHFETQINKHKVWGNAFRTKSNKCRLKTPDHPKWDSP